MSLGDIPLGKIQHMQVVGPVLDEVEVKEVIAHIEKGNIPSMLTLILHNQMVISKKLAQMTSHDDAKKEPEVPTGGGDAGKKPRRKTS